MCRGGQGKAAYCEELSPTLTARGYKDQNYIAGGKMGEYVVRRLTPRECERLQGFPDDYTDIHVKCIRDKKAENGYRTVEVEETPDAPRYKAMGNSMCVNVMRWIGERIDACERAAASDDGQA